MPYHKERDHEDCASDEPWAVVKDDDGSLMGCHETEEEADDQIAALEANEDEEEESADCYTCGDSMSELVIPDSLPLQAEDPQREQGGEGQPGRILVASGTQSRNRDYWSGKPYRVIPSGIRTEHWRKNGSSVLWMHNFMIPLAKGELFKEGGQLWAWDDFTFHRKVIPVATQNFIGDAIGEFDTGVIADLWQERYLNAVSIHVMFTPEDEENVVETENELIFPNSELLEFSIVTVPGDREATRERFMTQGMDAHVADLLCSDGACRLVTPGQGAYQGGPIKPGDDYYIGEQTKVFRGADLSPGVISQRVSDVSMTFDPNQKSENNHINTDNLVRRIVDGFKDTFRSAPSGGEEQVEEETMGQQFTPLSDEEEEVTTPPAGPDTPAGEEGVREEEYEVETEEVWEIEMPSAVELAQAIADDPEALLVLAQAFVEHPQVREMLLHEVADLAPQRTVRLHLAEPKEAGGGRYDRGADQPRRQPRRESRQPVRQKQRQTRQPRRERVSARGAQRQNGVQEKPDHPLVRMVRST